MRALRIFLAFAASIWLYQAAVVLLGGFVAAMAFPKAYFDWFGRQHQELALALLQLASFALPVFFLVAAGTLSILRVFAADTKAVLAATLAGLLACYTYWLASWVLHVDVTPVAHGEPYPPMTRLMQLLAPPWWAVSGALAPWLGFSLAAWLSLREQHE